MRGREEGPTDGGPLTNEFGILDPDRPVGYYPGMRVPDAEHAKAMRDANPELIQRQKEFNGREWRRVLLHLYGAELERLEDLRTRLLYAHLEPWGA